MNLDNIGFGAGGGLLGTMLTYLGFKQRMDAVDKRLDVLESEVIYKDTHTECSRSWHNALSSIDKKLDIILAKDSK